MWKENNGFSFIEFVVTILVISFGLLALFRIWNYHISSQIAYLEYTKQLDKLEWVANGLSNQTICADSSTLEQTCHDIHAYSVLDPDEQINLTNEERVEKFPGLHFATLSIKGHKGSLKILLEATHE